MVASEACTWTWQFYKNSGEFGLVLPEEPSNAAGSMGTKFLLVSSTYVFLKQKSQHSRMDQIQEGKLRTLCFKLLFPSFVFIHFIEFPNSL